MGKRPAIKSVHSYQTKKPSNSASNNKPGTKAKVSAQTHVNSNTHSNKPVPKQQKHNKTKKQQKHKKTKKQQKNKTVYQPDQKVISYQLPMLLMMRFHIDQEIIPVVKVIEVLRMSLWKITQS